MEFFRKLVDLVLHVGDVERWRVLIDHIGHPTLYVVLFAIIFCETGLVVTPFLPGDSLLFAIGALAAATGMNLPVLVVLLIAAAIFGDAVNYWIGFRMGPAIFKRESGKLLNKEHLLRAQQFYEKHGGKTIILARFVPIIRTFAPFVAGIGRMNYFRFAAYNVVGGIAWVGLCVGAGIALGSRPWVQKNFEKMLVLIVVISLLPIVIEVIKARRGKRRGRDESLEPAVAGERPERF
ncbi:MAG: DedA family protein [Tepidisphaeraceae bacterium]